jgi:hypothetical protein
MCGYTIDLIDFDRLSEAQKKALLQNYQRVKKELQTEMADAKRSLRGIERALKIVKKQSKRRAK